MNIIEKDANEVIPNLWLGNRKAAYDKDFLQKYNIKYILTIMDNFDEKYKFPNIIYLILPLKDKDIKPQDLFNIYEKGNDFIANSLKENSPILIHCKRGHHRSASLVASYLIKYLNINNHIAIIYIKSIRPYAFRRKTNISNGLENYYSYVKYFLKK